MSDNGSNSGAEQQSPSYRALAAESVRAMLNRAEEYHTAVYMHETLKPIASCPSPVTNNMGYTITTDKHWKNFPNVPMVPVTEVRGKWIPQREWMAAAATVARVHLVRHRPALAESSAFDTWVNSLAACTAMRAAAWDYVMWVPRVKIIHVEKWTSGGAHILNDGSGKTLVAELARNTPPAWEPSHVGLMQFSYDMWPEIYRIAYLDRHRVSSDGAQLHAVNVLASKGYPKGMIWSMMGSDDAAMTLLFAAYSAIPPEHRDTVYNMLDNYASASASSTNPT